MNPAIRKSANSMDSPLFYVLRNIKSGCVIKTYKQAQIRQKRWFLSHQSINEAVLYSRKVIMYEYRFVYYFVPTNYYLLNMRSKIFTRRLLKNIQFKENSSRIKMIENIGLNSLILHPICSICKTINL